MAKARAQTILLVGDPIFGEAQAGGAITPGHLLLMNSAGRVIVHASQGAPASRMIARENDIAGDDLNHAYASGEKCLFFSAYPGCVAQVRKAAATITRGQYVGTGANGVVIAATPTANNITQSLVGIALETSSAAGLIRVRFI